MPSNGVQWHNAPALQSLHRSALCAGLNRVLGLGLSPEDQELLFKARKPLLCSAAEQSFECGFQELSQKKKGAAMAWALGPDGPDSLSFSKFPRRVFRITSSARLSTLGDSQTRRLSAAAEVLALATRGQPRKGERSEGGVFAVPLEGRPCGPVARTASRP